MEKKSFREVIESLVPTVNVNVDDVINTAEDVVTRRLDGCSAEDKQAVRQLVSLILAVLVKENRALEHASMRLKDMEERVSNYNRWWQEAEEKAKKSERKLDLMKELLELI